MMNGNIEGKIIDLAKKADLYKTSGGREGELELRRVEAELIAEIDRCDALPDDIFAPLKLPKDSAGIVFFKEPGHNDYTILRSAPDLFIHIMKRFPGQFERIVGYMYMAVPELLKAAIDLGEKITLRIYKENEEGRMVYREPACHVPLRRLEDAQTGYIIELNHGKEEAQYYDYHKEIERFGQCVRMLMSVGSHVNDRDCGGGTLLMSLFSGDFEHAKIMREAIRILISLGARPDLPSSVITGNTPLHAAMELFGDPVDLDVLEALLDCPTPIDLAVPNHLGWTPLDSIIFNYNIPAEAVRLYLERNKKQLEEMAYSSDLLEAQYYKYSLLYQLAEREHPRFEELSDLLIQYGASVKTLLNANGKMPYWNKQDRLDVGDWPHIKQGRLEAIRLT